jgi:hypothetical protein
MIMLARRQARRLRGLFRRSVLGIAHRGPIPPLVLRAEGTQLRAHHRYATLAVEHVAPGTSGPPEVLALPLESLADIEGRGDAPVGGSSPGNPWARSRRSSRATTSPGSSPSPRLPIRPVSPRRPPP